MKITAYSQCFHSSSDDKYIIVYHIVWMCCLSVGESGVWREHVFFSQHLLIQEVPHHGTPCGTSEVRFWAEWQQVHWSLVINVYVFFN